MNLVADESALIRDLFAAFHKQGEKLVVLLNTASAVEAGGRESAADAILWIGLPGQQSGNAIADTLSGKANPSGKLVETWPVKYSDVPDSDHKPLSAAAPAIYGEDIYVVYRYYDTKGVVPQYACAPQIAKRQIPGCDACRALVCPRAHRRDSWLFR